MRSSTSKCVVKNYHIWKQDGKGAWPHIPENLLPLSIPLFLNGKSIYDLKNGK